jgi:hypothetical protein
MLDMSHYNKRLVCGMEIVTVGVFGILIVLILIFFGIFTEVTFN